MSDDAPSTAPQGRVYFVAARLAHVEAHRVVHQGYRPPREDLDRLEAELIGLLCSGSPGVDLFGTDSLEQLQVGVRDILAGRRP